VLRCLALGANDLHNGPVLAYATVTPSSLASLEYRLV